MFTQRPYQIRAVAAADEALQKHRSVLLVLATGLGKSSGIFFFMADDRIAAGQRILFIAHREELLAQTAAKFYKHSGIVAAIEMAQHSEGSRRHRPSASVVDMFGGGDQGVGSALAEWCATDDEVPNDATVTADDHGRPVLVVASVQSIHRRLDRYPRDAFDLVVIDEAHRSTATTYRKVVDHFSARVLGLTATPTRGDKAALGKIYETTAYQYGILPAINDGWLVPMRAKTVKTRVDFSAIRTSRGDFHQGDLAKVMISANDEICGPIVAMSEGGSRQTIVFAVNVAHAHALAMGLRDHLRDLAVASSRPPPPEETVIVVTGDTPKDERRAMIEAFHAGRARFFVNCAVAIEGFDAAGASCVAVAAPTKSLLRYMQQAGRGTRPLPGVVDATPEDGAEEQRREAIAASAKPDCLVIDFAGNAGRHEIVSCFDALAGSEPKPVKAIAKRLLDQGKVDDIVRALEMAREEIARMEADRGKARRSEARTSFSAFPAVVFADVGVEVPEDAASGRSITAHQRKTLLQQKFDPKMVSTLSASQAEMICTEIRWRWKKGLCTFSQARLLCRPNRLQDRVAMALTGDEARRILNSMASSGWMLSPAIRAKFCLANMRQRIVLYEADLERFRGGKKRDEAVEQMTGAARV